MSELQEAIEHITYMSKNFPQEAFDVITANKEEVLDYLIGDAVTSGLNDIIYYTYDGNMELLQNTIRNEYVNEYVRSELLEVMGQLYLDGVLAEMERPGFYFQMLSCQRFKSLV